MKIVERTDPFCGPSGGESLGLSGKGSVNRRGLGIDRTGPASVPAHLASA
ncbi:MAG: hypothetical protein ACPL7M_12830 [Bryobacteraceae bacterium]